MKVRWIKLSCSKKLNNSILLRPGNRCCSRLRSSKGTHHHNLHFPPGCHCRKMSSKQSRHSLPEFELRACRTIRVKPYTECCTRLYLSCYRHRRSPRKLSPEPHCRSTASALGLLISHTICFQHTPSRAQVGRNYCNHLHLQH